MDLYLRLKLQESPGKAIVSFPTFLTGIVEPRGSVALQADWVVAKNKEFLFPAAPRSFIFVILASWASEGPAGLSLIP
jgi:hypothetical protein